MKKRLYKKGGKEMLLSIGGVVLAVAVIFLAVYIILSLSKSFSPPEEQASIATYDNLISQISKMMLKTNQPFMSRDDFSISLSGYNTIVAFNKGEDFAIDGCHPPEKIQKPKDCGDSACICRYKPGYYEDFIGNNVLKKCLPLPGVDYIFTLNYADFYYKSKNVFGEFGVGPKIYKNIVGRDLSFVRPFGYPEDDYAYFFVYGHCDGWGRDEDFDVQRMYVEKYYDKDTKKTYIFIAAYTPQLANSRRQMFGNLLQILQPADPEELLKKLAEHCGKQEGLWYLEVELNSELLKTYAGYEDRLANYEDCIKQAKETMENLIEITERDIEGEREELPPPEIYEEIVIT